MHERYLNKAAGYNSEGDGTANSPKSSQFVQNGHSKRPEVARPKTADPTSLKDVQLPPLLRRGFDAIRYLYGPHPGFQYRSKAFDTLVLLRKHPLLAAKELVYTHCQLIVQQLAAGHYSDSDDDIDFAIRSVKYRYRLRDLFRRKSYLSRELTAAVIAMIAQQTSGRVPLLLHPSSTMTDVSMPRHQRSDLLFRPCVHCDWPLHEFYP